MEPKPRAQFLREYHFKPADLRHSGMSYQDLVNIADDFQSKFDEYDKAGIGVLRSLLRFGVVHALKYRIKEPEHLMAKILRTRLKNPSQQITLFNYREVITDLIGIRILHLIKSHWYQVHEILQNHYEQHEAPVANVRAGDPEPLIKSFTDCGCEIKVHPYGYRSVHYLIRARTGKKKFKVEVQVRTIFEESWGEIDHAVRYPHITNEPLMLEFLKILNRLAGSADEMAEFVLGLKEEVLAKARLSEELRAEIGHCMRELKLSSAVQEEKEQLLMRLENLRSLVTAQGERPLLNSVYLPDKDEAE